MADVTVNGKPVAIPDILSCNLDEAEVMFDLYGVEIDKMNEAPRHKLLRALLHVGVQRSEPDATVDEVNAAVGKVELGALMEAFIDDEDSEGDALPPALRENSNGSGGSSGRASVRSSVVPVSVAPSTSGTPGSDTSE